MYDHSQWPIKEPEAARFREINHASWAIRDAVQTCDVVHVQSAQALAFSRFSKRPFLLTLHGPHEAHLSEFYSHYPGVEYVAISEFQAKQESMARLHTIHHGIDLDLYRFVPRKQKYLSF